MSNVLLIGFLALLLGLGYWLMGRVDAFLTRLAYHGRMMV